MVILVPTKVPPTIESHAIPLSTYVVCLDSHAQPRRRVTTMLVVAPAMGDAYSAP